MIVFIRLILIYNALMQDIRKEIGNIIKKNRKLLNYTQAELANMVGVDPKYISRIETGASYPSLSIVEKIFDTLNITLRNSFETNQILENRNILIENINKNLKILHPTELQALDSIINFLTKKA